MRDDEWRHYYSILLGVPDEIMDRNNPKMKDNIIKVLSKQLSNIKADISHSKSSMMLKQLYIDKNIIEGKLSNVRKFW